MTIPESIRLIPIDSANPAALWEFLYQAVFTPPGGEPPAREIIYLPELARYVEGWGRPGDLGLYAVSGEGAPIGAAWMRLWQADQRGYGWVSDDIPELSLAMLPDWRGRGLGTRLIDALLAQARTKFEAVSLSVSRDNPAMRLYRRAGFETVGEDDHSFTMVLRFAG